MSLLRAPPGDRDGPCIYQPTGMVLDCGLVRHLYDWAISAEQGQVAKRGVTSA